MDEQNKNELSLSDKCMKSLQLANQAKSLDKQFFTFQQTYDLYSVRHGRRNFVHPGLDKERAESLAAALNAVLENHRKTWEAQAREMVRE